MRKFLKDMAEAVTLAAGVAAVLVLVACGGGSTVTGPDVAVVEEAPVPVVAATPAPKPVAAPPVGGHDAKVKGGFYSITNETGIPQFYCAAAFGVLPGGEQSKSTNIYEDQGVRNAKDIFSGQAPKKAACQYEKIQVDLTQSKDCKNFDWQTVLAAEVYANPDYVKGDAFDELEGTSTVGAWSNVEGQCGSRVTTYYSAKKYRCSGEIVRTVVRTSTEEKACYVPTCADLNPNKGAVTKSIAKVTTLHAGTAVYKAGYTFQSNDTKNIQACEAKLGSWIDGNVKMCVISKWTDEEWRGESHLFGGEGNPAPKQSGFWNGNVKISDATPDKYSVTVTVNYAIAAGAAQTVKFNIDYVQQGPDFTKKSKTVQAACGQAVQGTLVWQQGDQYNDSPNYSANDGHVTGSYVVTTN